MEDICWIDTANQISNSWYKKICICFFFENSKQIFSLVINHKFKLKIKDKLKDYEERTIVGNLQSFLIYLCTSKINSEKIIFKTYICPDFQPKHEYDRYLQKCFSFHGKMDLFKKFNFKFKDKETKSKAHSKVRKVYSGRKKENYNFDQNDLNNFIKYFLNQNYKKKSQVNSP